MVNYPFQWKIYYSDGSTFTDADGSWESSPPWGVQAIVFLRPDVNPPKLGGRGWEICQGGSFFRKTDDGHFVACDNDALLDYVANVLGVVKVGRMLSAAEFREITAVANGEMGELNKQGFTKSERE